MRQPAVLHVDLDGAAEIYGAHGWRYEPADDPLFETGLRHALEFFASQNVRATLFAIAQQLEHPARRALLREAVQQGHEIASHTVTHRHLSSLTAAEKRREIFESRERLSQALSVEVRGFRAPGFRMDRQSLDLIAEAGYGYDSSLFPNQKFARQAGVARISEAPHRPLPGRDLVELSMPSASPLPFPFHPCFSLVLGMAYFRAALARFRRRSVPLVFLFHLTDFAEPLAHRGGFGARFYTLSYLSGEHKRRRCRQMLSAVRESFRLSTTRELIDTL